MNLGQFLDPKVQKTIALALVSERAAEIVDGYPLDEVGEALQELAGNYPEWEERISEKYWFFGEEDFDTAKEAFPAQFESYQKGALQHLWPDQRGARGPGGVFSGPGSAGARKGCFVGAGGGESQENRPRLDQIGRKGRGAFRIAGPAGLLLSARGKRRPKF